MSGSRALSRWGRERICADMLALGCAVSRGAALWLALVAI
jgi:hypothetical protein